MLGHSLVLQETQTETQISLKGLKQTVHITWHSGFDTHPAIRTWPTWRTWRTCSGMEKPERSTTQPTRPLAFLEVLQAETGVKAESAIEYTRLNLALWEISVSLVLSWQNLCFARKHLNSMLISVSICKLSLFASIVMLLESPLGQLPKVLLAKFL